MSETETNTALATAESILIDGANGVTREARAHFPNASLGLFAWAIVAVMIIAARKKKHLQTAIAAISLLVFAAPGLIHVFGLRADAPHKRSQVASAILMTLQSLMTLAPWPTSNSHVVREDDAFFPLGRYAIPSREDKPGKRMNVELRSGALGTPCENRSDGVVCGSDE